METERTIALCVVAVAYLSYSEKSEQSLRQNDCLFGFVNLDLNSRWNGGIEQWEPLWFSSFLNEFVSVSVLGLKKKNTEEKS